MNAQGYRNVLLTGATGFLGKVVLEELLRQSDIFSFATIVLIVRGKKGVTGHDRFLKDTATSRCFSQLPNNWKESVRILDGDLGLPHCGLGKEDYEWVTENVTHVIHVAGHVKFDGEISEAVNSNIQGALNILSLSKACKYLQRLVTTSTAYSAPSSTEPIFEELPALPVPAAELYNDLIDGKYDKEEATKLTGHPNIYSLSKCLAEHLLAQQHGSVPLTIVRPSIICASWKHPMPGWIDSKAAFGGFVAGFAAGLLCVVNGQRDAKLDIVPVDEVACCLIVEALRFEEKSMEEELRPRIVFCVATTSNSFTLDEACRLLSTFFKHRKQGFRTPTFRYIGPRNFLFRAAEILYHQAPSLTMTAVLRLLGRRQEAVAVKKAYRVIKAMNIVFAPYSSHTYDFRPRNYVIHQYDGHQYMEKICEGVVENLM
ncbi:putative conserved hypothetical protein [Colletotrichum sublineola]|uniref:Fatty acyl-CoA reductase n=1 Tax=Colletotrichum sublineola TaxID=1173701 RepID=A0A066X4U9_COLSU|nr:putative conserved hypothetical protein [Colletotrichum sublineola]